MTDPFWPGDQRAGSLCGGPALVAAMVRVEDAWLRTLREAGITGANDVTDVALAALVTSDDVEEIAAGAEAGGNPAIPTVALLRERLASRDPAVAAWLHRGLTSQDVLDTALALCTADVVDRLRAELRSQIRSLAGLARRYRDSVMAGRTLTQYAVPITFGVKAATWLRCVLDAAGSLSEAIRLPAQIGGAAGTLAAVVELADRAGADDPAARALALAQTVAAALTLPYRSPWHTARAPVTRFADAVVGCCDAWGRIANDVLTSARPEVAELREPRAPGRGGSSTMPHKANPVLSVLIRRAALVVPHASARLHLAAAEAVDERPDGAWHTEWAELRDLCRAAVVAASHTSELLAGLEVDTQRMRERVNAAAPLLLAERESLPGVRRDRASDADDPGGYLGAAGALVDDALRHAEAFLGAGS